MKDDGFVALDTKAFDEALSRKQDLIRSYNAIDQEYDRIVKNLLDNWKGRGAAAFRKDAQTVKTNIVGIFDILKMLCDTLSDCKEVFTECDAALGEYNREPGAKKE